MDARDPFRGDWRDRLELIVDTTRRVSEQTDPEAMVRLYTERLRAMGDRDAFLSVSRRGLEPPAYRIARSSTWEDAPNPWTERDRLPVLQGGLLDRLLREGEPRLVDDLEVAPDDPAREYLEGMRSMIAIPIYDEGEARNLVVSLKRERAGFDPEVFPQQVWLTNLFSRGTHSLVLSQQLRRAHDEMAEEQQAIARIQKSLLPRHLPRIPGLQMAVHYRPTGRAGGDYYDVFELERGRWGILVADVSGHGTPAAVIMAITHAIVHVDSDCQEHPAQLLRHLNENLLARYTAESGTFVTALYGIYDPATRRFDHALAGHPAPRLKHCDDDTMELIPAAQRPPLGLFEDIDYQNRSLQLRPGDQMVLFTDGLPEARGPQDEPFGVRRIDQVLSECALDSESLIQRLLDEAGSFSVRPEFEDDLTILVVRVTGGGGDLVT